MENNSYRKVSISENGNPKHHGYYNTDDGKLLFREDKTWRTNFGELKNPIYYFIEIPLPSKSIDDCLNESLIKNGIRGLGLSQKAMNSIFEAMQLYFEQGKREDEIIIVNEQLSVIISHSTFKDGQWVLGYWKGTNAKKVFRYSSKIDYSNYYEGRLYPIVATIGSETLEGIPVNNGKSDKKEFDVCLWVHTDIDEPDITFTMLAKNKEEAEKNIEYMNKNSLKDNRLMEIMERAK